MRWRGEGGRREGGDPGSPLHAREKCKGGKGESLLNIITQQ